MMDEWIKNRKYLGSLVSQLVKNLPAEQATWVQSLGQGDPLENRMPPPLQYSMENSMNKIA